MKQLSWKLILPLAIISFVSFTKWWYVDVVDGPDEMLTGFPLPYKCPGWHTSLSLQIFVSALIIDFLAYLAFWGILILIIHRFIINIRMPKLLTKILIAISVLLIAGMIHIGSKSDNDYTWEKEFEAELLDTGYEFFWEFPERPDYYKYHPE